MKVSILMLTYNHENYIAQAIENVLSQQVNFDYELIIGEDCSSDKTREIVIEYASRFPTKIKPLLKSHLGAADNLRQCFEAADGEYISFCEGDDYWVSNLKLQKQVDLLDSDPNIAICFHNVLEIYDDPSIEPYCYCPDEQKTISTIEDLFTRNLIPTCSAMFRNHLIKNLPDWYYSLNLGDWTLYLLYAQYGYIYYLKEIMGAHRNHQNGKWSSKGLIWQCEEILNALSALHSHFSYNSDYQQLIRECAARHTLMIVEEYRKKGDNKAAEEYLTHSENLSSGRLENDQLALQNTIKSISKIDNLHQLTHKAEDNPSKELIMLRSVFEYDYNHYGKVILTPSTLVGIATAPETMEELLSFHQLLASDEYTRYVDTYYREAINRFGRHWRYLDISNVLFSASRTLQPQTYMEIGVRKGRSACMVVRGCPSVNIVAFDMWVQNYAGMENPGEDFVRQELKKHGQTGDVYFINGNSHQTVPAFFDQYPQTFFDMITVDGDHSEEGAFDDLCNIIPHLSVGGVLVFDDISHPAHPGLLNVWRKTMAKFPFLAGYEYTDAGFGVAFAIRKG